jgi:hypothetical protein
MTRRVHKVPPAWDPLKGRAPTAWDHSPSHSAEYKSEHFIVDVSFQTGEVTCFCSHVATVTVWEARITEWDMHMREVRATSKAEREAGEATPA